MAQLFKNHRSVKWQTIRIVTNRSKKKRMEFRIRQINGYLRYVGNVQLVCSQFKKRPKGRKKYLACSDLNAKARQIIIGYRMRWRIEIYRYNYIYKIDSCLMISLVTFFFAAAVVVLFQKGVIQPRCSYQAASKVSVR